MGSDFYEGLQQRCAAMTACSVEPQNWKTDHSVVILYATKLQLLFFVWNRALIQGKDAGIHYKCQQLHTNAISSFFNDWVKPKEESCPYEKRLSRAFHLINMSGTLTLTVSANTVFCVMGK